MEGGGGLGEGRRACMPIADAVKVIHAYKQEMATACWASACNIVVIGCRQQAPVTRFGGKPVSHSQHSIPC